MVGGGVRVGGKMSAILVRVWSCVWWGCLFGRGWMELVAVEGVVLSNVTYLALNFFNSMIIRCL